MQFALDAEETFALAHRDAHTDIMRAFACVFACVFAQHRLQLLLAWLRGLMCGASVAALCRGFSR